MVPYCTTDPSTSIDDMNLGLRTVGIIRRHYLHACDLDGISTHPDQITEEVEQLLADRHKPNSLSDHV